jgi:hypothetical protein
MTMLIQFRLDEVALGPLSLFKKLRECGVEKFELLPTGPQPTLPGSEDTGSWLFTANAKRKLVGNTARMPSPTKTAAKATKQDMIQEPAGRTPPGNGRTLLLQALAAGRNARAELVTHLGQSGISRKSAQSMLARAKADKLVTSNGRGVYALTTKANRMIAKTGTNR